jgi:Tol biopolymer transport system component
MFNQPKGRTMSFRHTLVSAIVAVAALAVPAAASANPALVFSHVTTQTQGTETVEKGGLFAARGEHVTSLTNNPADAEPNFSPDGDTIVFSRGGDLYSVRPDGTGERQLTGGPEIDSRPLFTNNGRTIVFERAAAPGAQRDIYTVGAQGGNTHFLVISADDDREVALSRNGKAIAFTRSEDEATGGTHDVIYSIRLNGNGIVRLSHGREDSFAPHYFAGGIVFDRGESSEGPSGFSDIYAMAANGAKPHRLVGGASSVYLQDVSADGKTMLFSRYQSLCEKTIAGGQPHKISSMPAGLETQAAYSPDGRAVAVRTEDYSDADPAQRLYTLNTRHGFEIGGLAETEGGEEATEEIGDFFAWQPGSRAGY